MILSLYIINKAGGLVYQRDFNEGLQRLSSNDYLILAGTFHSIHAITSRISPTGNSDGLDLLEADGFKLHCFQTVTGTKFLLVTDPSHHSVDGILRKIYNLYSDYVMKNPFYTPEMPIRVELFDQNLIRAVHTAL
ncbi:hypothetical protein H4R33_002923 [Dimargaris cristalligena]|uniref:Trafficking protein particle complex subunit n=1 Tax=Dimargaris cristalligena TaxID=215637 RepID=A0A4P9ZWN5_9FUNG|nr:hypothetical protein H4R33_002923 [Dimargaris cristalligena]RKP38037.1 Sybindin-like protein [Dimargaris cristalligena]|eukprot:RKP38037.1 Sybindin-like protein [Dimargaris cristalligena]